MPLFLVEEVERGDSRGRRRRQRRRADGAGAGGPARPLRTAALRRPRMRPPTTTL